MTRDQSSPDPRVIAEDDLRQMLRIIKDCLGSNAELARQLGIHEELVGAFLRGKRPPEPRLLQAIGAERVVTYRLKPITILQEQSHG